MEGDLVTTATTKNSTVLTINNLTENKLNNTTQDQKQSLIKTKNNTTTIIKHKTTNNLIITSTTKTATNPLNKTRSMPSSPNSFRQIQQQIELQIQEQNTITLTTSDENDQKKVKNIKHKYNYLSPITTKNKQYDQEQQYTTTTNLQKKISTSEPDIINNKQKLQNKLAKTKLSNSVYNNTNESNVIETIVSDFKNVKSAISGNIDDIVNKFKTISESDISLLGHVKAQPSESKSDSQLSSNKKTNDTVQDSCTMVQQSRPYHTTPHSSSSPGITILSKTEQIGDEDNTSCCVGAGDNSDVTEVTTDNQLGASSFGDEDSAVPTGSSDQDGFKRSDSSENTSSSFCSTSPPSIIMIPDSRGGNHLPPPLKHRNTPANTNSSSATTDDNGGLILPKKLQNPCLESSDRQNLHRELLFNQKIGKNVLNQKSELQRAMEKHKDSQAKKELELQRLEDKTPFEKVIEERARRLESLEKNASDDIKSKGDKPEFLQVHARLKAKMGDTTK